MKVSNRLQRSSVLAAGLVLLAGASGLFGQTAAQPALVLPTGNLYFAYQTGRAAPQSQTVRLYSGPENVNFTATATTTAGGGWLFLCTDCSSTASNVTQLTGNTGTGQNITISVSPGGLAASAVPYTGKVTITSGTSVSEVNVFLTVSATAQLSISPSSFPLQTVEFGAVASYPISVTSTDGTPVQYTATVENPTPNTGWLGVSPAVGLTGGQASVTVNTQLLPAGTTRVWGSLRFTLFSSSVSNQIITVPITVAITPAAQIQVSPTVLTFAYQPGFSSPGAKPVTVTSSTSTSLSYSVTPPTTGTNYFTLSTTGAPSNLTSLSGLSTPNGFWVQPNVAVLGTTPATGTYETPFTITSTNGSTQTFTARLQVTNQNILTSSMDSVNFTYTLGGLDLTPASITIGSTSQTLSFSAARALALNNPGFFNISAPNPFTPNAIQVLPDMSVIRTLPAGTYSGRVVLTSTGTTAVLEIPVTLTISGSAQISASTPPPFEGPLGVSAGERTVVVTSTDPSVQQNFSVTVDYGTGTGPREWLQPSITSGTTGSATTGTVRLTVDVTRFTAPGTYQATLIIRPTSVANGAPVYIPIQYIVQPSTASVTATPTSLSVSQSGSAVPANQTIQLNSPVTTAFTARIDPLSDTQFVSIAQTSPTIPGSIQITFNSAQLTARTEPYVNDIVINPTQPGLNALRIPVRLTVTAASNLQVSPTSLTFAFTTGGTAPTSQTVNVTSSGAAVPFTAAATTQQGGNWLSVTPANSTTNATGGAAIPLAVTVNPANLNGGTYTGAITLTPGGGGGQPVTVNVTLTVTQPNPPNNLQISNNASGISRGVSPGEFITIKGRNMAPGAAVVFTSVPAPTTLGEVRVLFDGVAAPVLYVGPSGDRTSDQINAIVPYGISGRASTNLVVEYRGVASATVPLTVRDTEPGLFTANSAGSGPASMLNQDSSFNTQTNPAALGSVVSIFGTGEGFITPNPGEGRVVPATQPFPALLNGPVVVRIGGRTAQVLYGGPAPGLLAGVFQINAVVPTDLVVSGVTQTSVEVQIGSTSSQPGVTFWVRGQQ